MAGVMAGAAAVVAGAKALLHKELPAPGSLPHAIAAEARGFGRPEGTLNYYHRPGTGTPIVFVHSLNAAASPFELEPLFDHFARTTGRPLYALDWLGFGRSDRPDLDVRPAIYQDHLFAFLQQVADRPADIVALSLGCEYAASVALQNALQVRRLVLLNPTGLGATRGASALGKAMVRAADATGLFELAFYRLTRPSSLRGFYERQIFLRDDDVPDALVDYAHVTSRALGAHHAPRRFIEGTLFLPDVADTVYARLYRPTLILTPENAGPTVQSFDRLPALLERNPRDLTHRSLPGGLLPHWEAGPAANACTDAIGSFFARPEPAVPAA